MKRQSTRETFRKLSRLLQTFSQTFLAASILFSPPACLGDDFSASLLGARRSLLASRSLAWDSRALSPHMTLAACTRLPNAYNATPANGAICGKSLPSNLSLLPLFYSSPLSPFLSFSLSPFCTCTLYGMHPLSPVHLSCSMPISCIQDLCSSLLSLIVSHSFLLLLLFLATLT